MANPRRLVACGVVAIAAALSAGCSSADVLELCGPIPREGCPVGRGGTCADPSCAAVYDCVGGSWRVTERCADDGGVGSALDAGASEAGANDAGCSAVVVDHTGEVTGCTPQLEEPDCPAVAAEQCARAACLTGCSDFFLCTKDGWRTVAHCDDSGHLVTSND